MSEIVFYTPTSSHGGMIPCINNTGSWAKREDYEALAAEAERLNGEIEWLKKRMVTDNDVPVTQGQYNALVCGYEQKAHTIGQLKAEVERLTRGGCGKVKNQPPDLTAGEFNRGE